MCLFTSFTFDGPIIPNLLQCLAHFVWTFSSSENGTLISPTRSLTSTKMRQDRIFARILLILSIANVALTAPQAEIVRQRHLDVAKAASEKRAPGFDGGETGDLPPEPSSSIAPHDLSTDNSRWDWLLWPDSPKSSSAAENHITTQASGAPGSGNGATGDLSPDSSSRIPPQDKWAWLYHGAAPESSSAAAGLGNGAMSDLPPMPPPDSRPTNEGLDRLSSDHSTTQASGATTPSLSGSVHSSASESESLSAQTEANRHFGNTLKDQILVSSGMIGIIAIAYGIHQLANHQYVSSLSPLSPADMGHLAASQTF